MSDEIKKAQQMALELKIHEVINNIITKAGTMPNATEAEWEGCKLASFSFGVTMLSITMSNGMVLYKAKIGFDDIEITDNVPLIHFNQKWIQFFQDFIAPFYLFTKASHSSKFTYTDNVYAPQKLLIKTEVKAKLVNYTFKNINFEIELKDNKLYKFTIHNKYKTETFISIS